MLELSWLETVLDTSDSVLVVPDEVFVSELWEPLDILESVEPAGLPWQPQSKTTDSTTATQINRPNELFIYMLL